ncbi:MAG: ABC transporter permease [Kocuria sp.]|nr:ABC transporter permease [Kocuria sp.]
MANDVKTRRQIVEALDARGLSVDDLAPIGIRPSLPEYLFQLWDRRHFIWADARHRVATQNSRNRLGAFWLLLRPLLDALMYFLIFGVILSRVFEGVDNVGAYIVIGVLMFRSSMRSISSGPTILSSGRSMIRAFSFPRATLPIAAELRDALQMQYTIAAVLLLIMVIPPHESPEWAWLLVAPIYVMQFFLNLGISLFTARIGFILPDVSQLMSFVGRFMMYGSGVIFPIDRWSDNTIVMTLIQVNPIYHMIIMYRQALIDGVMPSMEHWAMLGVWALGLTLIGFLFFWRGEATYGDE